MRKLIAPALAIAAVMLIAVYTATVLAKDKTVTASAGTAAPAFTLQDQSGKPVSLADYKGKYVVLEWFNNECPFVKRHYASGDINALAAKYATNDVAWLAINSTQGKTNDDNRAVAAEWKIERPILNDSTGTVGKAYGAKSTPHMFVIDKTGNVVYQGAIDDDSDGRNPHKVNYVDKALTELLAGKPVSEPETKSYGCGVKYAD